MIKSVLIIGDEGRFRDGLRTVLLSFSGIEEVKTVNDEIAAVPLIVRDFPSLIIIDGSDSLIGNCLAIKGIFPVNEIKPCIVIAKTLKDSQQAKSKGADAVLLQGFTTAELQAVITKFNSRVGIEEIGEPLLNKPEFNHDQQTQMISPS